MVIKSEVLEVVKEFNKSNRGIKAKFLDSGIGHVKIEFSGIFCRKTEDCHEFPGFKELLEAMVKQPVNVSESVRTGEESHRVTYTIGQEDPAEHILKILNRYEEGTPPKGREFED